MKSNIFKYLYCRMYWWNTHVVKQFRDNIPYVSLASVVTFQTLNVLTFIVSYNKYFLKKVVIYDNWLVYEIYALIFVVDYFLYVHRAKYKDIMKEFNNFRNDRSNRKCVLKNDIIIITYIVLTFGTMFGVLLIGGVTEEKLLITYPTLIK